MTKFYNQKLFAALGVLVVFFSLGALLATTNGVQDFFLSNADAAGTCGSCDDDVSTSGSTSGSSSFGSSNDRTDDKPDPAVCKFLKVEGKGDGGDDKTVVVPYGTTEVSLRYSTVYATKVTLNGKELSRMSNLDGRSTKIDGDTTFKLVAENAYGYDTCKIHIDVKEPVAPKCVSFNASPTTLPYGGGSVDLTWETQNAEDVKIKNVTTGDIIDVVNLNNTSGRSVNVSEDTTFRLVVIGAGDVRDTSCEVDVNVKDKEVTPEPKCEWFNASPTWLTKGEATKLTWSTVNAANVELVNETTGERVDVANNNGSGRSVNVYENTTFKLVVYGADGSKDNHCAVDVKVKTEQPGECAMEIIKSVDKSTAKVGEQLTYTIKIKNIGDEDCTGGGVKIIDKIDSNLSFVSQTHTSNLSAGYYSNTAYDSQSHQLSWNGHTLTPGESGTISWVGKVKTTPSQCGEYNIFNEAKATAKELNNFQTWVYSNKVKTVVEDDCDYPNPPVCPLAPNTDKVIVDFGTDKIFSDRGLDSAHTDRESVNLASGDYKVVLVGWDGYNGRENDSQPNESYFINFYNGSTKIAESNAHDDLADYVRETTKVQTVNSKLSINSAVTAIEGFHTVYPDNSSANSLVPICASFERIPDEKKPVTCEDNANFSADPTSLPYGGGDVTLSWNALDVDSVKLDGVSVSNSDTVVKNIGDDKTFVLEITGDSSTTGNTVQCPIKVKVDDPGPDPISCEDHVTFTADRTSLPFGGGDVTLQWNTTDIEKVELDGESVALDGTKVVDVNFDRTFTLEVKGDNTTTGNTDQCKIHVTVGVPDKLTCEDVDFTASDYSVKSGSDITLYWSWNDNRVYEASIDNGIGDVNNNGSEVVEINDDSTYRITIKDAHTQVSCPVSIDVESGGGGGGSSRPRCDLDISDEKIKLGEEVTLTWDTSRASEVVIEDDHGNVIVTTEDKLSDDKKDLYDGEITLKPTKDTKYTLNASRGSKDKECEVEVEVENNITVLQTRNQEPRVAGIALTQVPYTGFEAGPALTILFYVLLTLWALYVAYVMVIKRDSFGGVSFAGTHDHVKYTDASVNAVEKTNFSAAETYVKRATVAPVTNLPTVAEVAPAVGYASTVDVVDTEALEQDLDFTALENHAHMHKTLISSDAMRYFIATNGSDESAMEKMTDMIAEGKKNFPSEDGWLVLNLARIEELMADEEVMAAENVTAPINLPTVSAQQVAETVEAKGAGSLAEAIVTGNIVAAYQMVANRPMIALADAATDLDAVYRIRKGEEAQVSDLLMFSSTNIPTEKIAAAIAALTGALDGTYTDEAEAVKMAILKAVKVVS